MDGDWYESTMDILVHLYEHVSHTGFIQVDDYGYWEGCRQAMWDYAAEKGFTFNVHPIDGTGVWLQRPDRQPTDLMLLNLGCGGHFHRDWINIDIAPAAPEVIQHDLAREPLPFEDRSCAAVYHSHVLEHIPPEHVGAFLAECHRVLDVEGVLRIAVPDLEQIVREYLKQLDAQDRAKHGWMVIELVDQLTRNASGGKMMEYWKQNPMPAEDFVLKRLGREAIEFVIQWRQNPSDVSRPQLSAETIGRFRLSGEVHAWMYDRLSLSHLLEDAGFQSVRVCGASDSAIPGYASYCLDADANGLIRKPDSLFIEAQKPAVASA
jgi:SAM-dependent methyltransferase